MIRRLREGFAAILDTMRHMATLVDPGEDDGWSHLADVPQGCDDPDCTLHVYDQQLDTPDWLAWSQELTQ